MNLTIYPYLIACLLVVANFFDGIRDSEKNIGRTCHSGYWHVVKWISTWPIWIVLWLTIWPEWLVMLIAVALSWVAFKVGYRIALPREKN